MVKKIKRNKLSFALDTVRGRVTTALAAVFAFVIALSWNDSIKKGVDSLIVAAGVSGETYIYSILATLSVTVIGVFGIYIASKLAVKKGK